MFVELLDAARDDAGYDRPLFNGIDRKADVGEHFGDLPSIRGQFDILSQPR